MKRFRPRVKLFASLDDISLVKTFLMTGFFDSDILCHQHLGNAFPYGYHITVSTIGMF